MIINADDATFLRYFLDEQRIVTNMTAHDTRWHSFIMRGMAEIWREPDGTWRVKLSDETKRAVKNTVHNVD